jgi:hypothetical protein
MLWLISGTRAEDDRFKAHWPINTRVLAETPKVDRPQVDSSHVATRKAGGDSLLAHFELLHSIVMAATLPFQVSCPLLALPGEVRLEVYRYLFEGAQLAVESTHPAGSPCGFTICSCFFPWHILQTCKKLRSEALPYLLASTSLEVSSTMVKATKIPSAYLSIIPKAVVLDAKAFSNMPLQLHLFSSLRSLELRNITIWCKYHDEAYLQSEEGDESMFGLAMFNLSRISNSLAELCLVTRQFSIRLHCQFVVSSFTQQTIVGSSLETSSYIDKFKHAVIDVDSKTVLQKSKGPSMTSRNHWAGFY